ncbi:MAG: endo-1,4-beta-xylanase [Clostridia bacterium]|nr:endo-1,4-beta-xylanase [Clostridia bacterium]
MSNGLESVIKKFDSYDYYLNGKIARDIEENRKGQFVLTFKNESGEALSDVHVKVRQKRHAFKFGCGAFYLDQFEDEERRTLYRERFKELFNYAVVPFYWDTLEPEQGKPRFAADSPFVSRRPPIDTIMEFCEENKIRAKGHCLVYNSFQPKWISDDNEVLKRQITKRIKEIAEKYGDRIFDFDVINEMITVYKNAYVGNGARNLQITDEPGHEKWAFDTCRRYFPNANLYWNEGMYETFGQHYKGFRSFYYLMIEKMLREGVKIDGLGMQYHAYTSKEKADIKLAEVCNPLRMIDVLERYGDFKLPIHISEVSIPSYSNESYDEQLQAELTERLFKLWFSSRYCESIVWWNLCDNTAYKTESIYHSGLLRYDCTEKPVYKALCNLINKEWNTTLEDTVSGQLRFSGFYGEYDIETEYQGKKSVVSVNLTRDNTGYDNRLCDFRAKEIVL